MLKQALITFVNFYRRFISPLFQPSCRFYPTCSEYAVVCLEKYPVPSASGKILRRLGKCQPWHPGGIDLP